LERALFACCHMTRQRQFGFSSRRRFEPLRGSTTPTARREGEVGLPGVEEGVGKPVERELMRQGGQMLEPLLGPPGPDPPGEPLTVMTIGATVSVALGPPGEPLNGTRTLVCCEGPQLAARVGLVVGARG
jgi:hypothetical protein